MSTFGSTAGVALWVRHMTTDGNFTKQNYPQTADVTLWLDQRSAMLLGWLALAGYEAVADWSLYSNAKLILDHYANNGAAGDAELSLRGAGNDDDDENARENKFLAEFNRAEKFILSGALDAMGVPRVDDEDDADLTPGFLFGTVGTRRYTPPTEWSDL